MRWLLWILISFLCLGFRTFSARNVWDIDNTAASRSKLFVVFDRATDSIINDLPSDDPLGAGSLTVQSVMNSIFNDYNNIQASYINLVSSSDMDYVTLGTGRTITIINSATDGVTGGQAKWEYQSGRVSGCSIRLANSAYNGAKQFIRVVTHELGHCLGLDHSQETVNSVMSYFSDSTKVFRLQDDDKMGIIFLYPVTPDYGKEASTFGLSCSRR